MMLSVYKLNGIQSYFILHFIIYSSLFTATVEQEGQHPLTGQRAANFRLLANQ